MEQKITKNYTKELDDIQKRIDVYSAEINRLVNEKQALLALMNSNNSDGVAKSDNKAMAI